MKTHKCRGSQKQKNNIRYKYPKLDVEKSAEACQFMTNTFPASNVQIFVYLILWQCYLTQKDNVRCKCNFIRDVTSHHYICLPFPLYKNNIWMCPFCSFDRPFSSFPWTFFRLQNAYVYDTTVKITLLLLLPWVRKLRQDSDSIYTIPKAHSISYPLHTGSFYPRRKVTGDRPNTSLPSSASWQFYVQY
jgi:hypothetical protein